MRYRFRFALAKRNELLEYVERAKQDLLCNCGELCEFEGDTVVSDVIRNGFYVMDNLDLYVSDDIPSNMVGYMMKVLRAKGFLEEDARRIPDNHIGLHLVRSTERQ